MLKRRKFLKYLGLTAFGFGIPGIVNSKTTNRKKPNFIIIFTDDQGYQDIGCYGATKIKTPNLDKMAGEGMKFMDFYSSNSVCSPSRASLMTGCYPTRVGITGVLFPRDKKGLNPEQITIAEILKEQGYATACVGKWHLGHLPEFLPVKQGFDQYFGIPYSNDMWIDPNMELAEDIKLNKGWTVQKIKKINVRKAGKSRHQVPLMRNDKVIEFPAEQAHLTKRYTEESIKFITKNKNKPFFLYLPHTMPHIPLYVSEEFKGKSKQGLYGDVIEEIDWSTGEILKSLKQLGIDKNTFVIFTSDNGPWLKKKDKGGSALPLRGGKFSTYEGGMRVPCIMRWPGRISSGSICREVAGTIDFFPTLARLAGAKLSSDRIIDGKDILPLMEGRPGARSPHEAYYYYKGKTLEAVRAGEWKLRIIDHKKKKKRGKGKPKPAMEKDQSKKKKFIIELYNLKQDISESNNLAEKRPEIVKKLKTMMINFDKKLKEDMRPAGGAGKK